MGNAEAESPRQPEKAPKILRFLVRLWGALAGVAMLSTGLFVLITLSASCLVAGILQICFGAFVIPLEAPMFCTYFTTLIKISDWVDSHFRFWMRAFLYGGMAIPPCFLCMELSTFLGCGALLVLAALYGVLAIGKKGADADKVRTDNNEDVELKTKLMKNNGEPNNDDLNTY